MRICPGAKSRRAAIYASDEDMKKKTPEDLAMKMTCSNGDWLYEIMVTILLVGKNMQHCTVNYPLGGTRYLVVLEVVFKHCACCQI